MLQNNLEPDTTLFELWKETTHYRLSDNNKNKETTYPALKKPTGYLLVKYNII